MTPELAAVVNGRNCSLIENETFLFERVVALAATIFESIANSEKASCTPGGYENKDIFRQMYRSIGYVCGDEDGWPSLKNGN